MATIKSLLKIGGDADDAKRAIREAREELRQFAHQTAEANAEVRTEGARAELEALTARLDRLSKREATPTVKIAMARTIEQIDRLEARLARLNRKSVTVDVDVKRGGIEQVNDLVGGATRGVAAGLGGLLGNLPVIGGLFQGLTSSFGTTAIGAGAAAAAILGLATVLAALVASLGAALAGLGALTVAFAGALGPAVLVAVATFARLAQIVKAVTGEEKSHVAVAGQVTAAAAQRSAANQALADAYRNVAEQAKAARQAQEEAARAIPRDKLSLQEARLRKRETDKALRDFRNQSGTDGQGFDSLFRRFSDVNFQGDPSKLVAALNKQGASIGGDKGLQLQRLILDQRGAVLGLSDALHKLHGDQDRNNQFAEKGIRAYEPYNAALRQVAAAQRQVASATRASTAAAEKSSSAFGDLTPAEQRFGETLVALGQTLKTAFTPAILAVLAGVTRGLQRFAAAAKDPQIQRSLLLTGQAMGKAFADLAKTLTSPEIRRAFAEFALTGARIIRTFGTRVFSDLALVLTRLAVATLPLLVRFLDRVTAWFDSLERSSRNTKNLRDDVKHLVDVFNDWVTLLGKTATLLLGIGKFLEPIGTGLVRFLSDPIDQLGKLGEKIAGTERDAKPLGETLQRVGRTVAGVVSGMVSVFQGFLLQMRGIFKIIAAILTLNFGEALSGAKDLLRGTISQIRGILRSAVAPFQLLGKKIGGAIAGGVKSAFDGVIGFVEDRVNNLIDAFNALPGHKDLPHVGVKSVSTTGGGGSAAGDALGNFGAALGGKIKQRTPPHRTTPGQKQARISSLGSFALGDIFTGLNPNLGGALAGATSGDTIVTAPITVVGGGPPEPEILSELLERKLQRLGRGR